jgi:translocation protein SEC63
VILASQISNFSTWSNLTILLLWIVVIFLVYYIKLSSREVRFLFAGRSLSLSSFSSVLK